MMTDQDRLEEELRFLMGSKVGRRFFSRMMERGRVHLQSTTGCDRNPQMTAYRNGGRDLALSFYQDAEDICPDALTTAFNEYVADRKEIRQEEEDAQKEGRASWMTMV